MKIPRAKMEIEGGHAEARVLYLEARVGGLPAGRTNAIVAIWLIERE